MPGNRRPYGFRLVDASTRRCVYVWLCPRFYGGAAVVRKGLKAVVIVLMLGVAQVRLRRLVPDTGFGCQYGQDDTVRWAVAIPVAQLLECFGGVAYAGLPADIIAGFPADPMRPRISGFGIASGEQVVVYFVAHLPGAVPAGALTRRGALAPRFPVAHAGRSG